MRRSRNKPTYHFRLSPSVARKFDEKIAQDGFTYRSEFFKAVIYSRLHGSDFSFKDDIEHIFSDRQNRIKNACSCAKLDSQNKKVEPRMSDAELRARELVQKLPKSVTAWLAGVIPETEDEEILVGLHKTLEKHLLPAIAMRGVDVIFEDTWEMVRDLYHEESGIWVTESDCLEAYQSFELLRKRELEQYRDELRKKRQLEGEE